MELPLFMTMTGEMGALFSVSAHPQPRNVTPVMRGGVTPPSQSQIGSGALSEGRVPVIDHIAELRSAGQPGAAVPTPSRERLAAML